MISAKEIAAKLGQKFPPNDEQAQVIEADPNAAALVVAGAGAGKTETMAARVVWLVANGLIPTGREHGGNAQAAYSPDRVLGLTFTNKAARELGQRIRQRLLQLAASGVHPPAVGKEEFQQQLASSEPMVLTYDSYAAKLVKEYGLLVPCEPAARVIAKAEMLMIARDVVRQYTLDTPILGSGGTPLKLDTVVKYVVDLEQELTSHLVEPAQLVEDTTQLLGEIEALGPREAWSGDVEKIYRVQRSRLDLLPMIELLRARLAEQQLVTFGQQMQYAARLASDSARVRAEQRQRFGVIMLDEYQDTSHAQRIMLSKLFQGKTVTAVGDPMQSIYGWRGATAANLERVLQDYGTADAPAQRRQMTVSFRNPAAVLEYANVVADSALGPAGGKRLVDPLVPFEKAAKPVATEAADAAGLEAAENTLADATSPGASSGQEAVELPAVKLAFFQTRKAEMQWVAQQFQGYQGSAAVLVRSHKLAGEVASALEEAGIPHEIIGLAGLLSIPEVQDLKALATLLIRPNDVAAATRILGGPLMSLSAADFAALGRWENQLTKKWKQEFSTKQLQDFAAEQAGDRFVHQFQSRLAEQLSEYQVQGIGIGEAIATWAEHSNAQLEAQNLKPPKFSREAKIRLRQLHKRLKALRSQALHYGLADLFAEIEQAFGLRAEVLQRENPHAPGAAGTAHLDAFASHVVDYMRTQSGDLAAFLDFCDVVQKEDDGFARGEVIPREDSVQILTVHKSKGLEWDNVAVVGAEEKTYAGNAELWLTTLPKIPNTLRGDRQRSVNDTIGVPVLPETLFEDALAAGKEAKLPKKSSKDPQLAAAQAVFKALDAGFKEYGGKLKEIEAMEAERLFYVAITRSKRKLFISGSANLDQNQRPLAVLPAFGKLAQHAVQAQLADIAHWPEIIEDERIIALENEILGKDQDQQNAKDQDQASSKEQDQQSSNPDAGDLQETSTPEVVVYPPRYEVAGREELTELLASQSIPEFDDSFALAAMWEADVDALIAEHQQLQDPEVAVPLPLQLSPTALIALREDPTDYARRLARPIPYEPVPFAKRGTAFHQWVEETMYQGDALLENEMLLEELGPVETETDDILDQTLKDLKEAFRQSQWYQHKGLVGTEVGFQLELGGHTFSGRIDAVFRDDDGTYTVVDWKTGKVPNKASLQQKQLQLALYRLAWAARQGIDPQQVKAAFYYVAHDYTLWCEHLPSAAEIAGMLEDAYEFKRE